MNKNLPIEIWDMIHVIRRSEFRRRIEEFSAVFIKNVLWKGFFNYRSFWRRATFHSPAVYHFSAYTMSNVKFYSSYTHENRSGIRRGPKIKITVYMIIHFKYGGCISHYEFVKRGVLGCEIIKCFHPFRNE